MTTTQKQQTTWRSVSETLRDAMPYLHMGWQFLATVLLFVAAGWAVDSWLNTSPWLLIAFSMLGSAAGLYYMIHASNQMAASEKKRKSTSSGSNNK